MAKILMCEVQARSDVFDRPILFVDNPEKEGYNYIVPMRFVPRGIYTVDRLHIVDKWWEARKYGFSSSTIYAVSLRSTIYFKMKEFTNPNRIYDLADFDLMALSDNILIQPEDRVDIGKSVVYTYEDRRKSEFQI